MENKLTLENYMDNHYIHRSNWLRAAVLGANDANGRLVMKPAVLGCDEITA